MRTCNVRRRTAVSRGRETLVLLTTCFMAQAGIAYAQEVSPAPTPEPSVPVAPTPAEAAPPAAALSEPVLVPVHEAPEPAPAKPPPPYSLPWQLRPVAPATVLRLDTSYAFYENPANDSSGSALATSLLGSYKIIPDLALIARVGLVSNGPPDAVAPAVKPDGATSFLNPVLAGLYGIKLPANFKLGLFLGIALPFGSGGGKNPNPGRATANAIGISTRSAFDNAMFAVDYFTVFPGVDLAYVKGGLTVQAEATLLKLTKVRGPDAEDDSRVNFTTGLHVGYFFAPLFSVGAEIRHQRWLSTPTNVKNDKTDSLRDTTTFAFGPRFHFKLSEKTWFRPGVSLTLPIDDPMKKAEYRIVQLDLPVSF